MSVWESIYRGIIGLITLFMMPLSNYRTTTQYSHMIIMGIHGLQVFLHQVNHWWTRVTYWNTSSRTSAMVIAKPSAALVWPSLLQLLAGLCRPTENI
jgi:hypothetical protein